MTSRKETEATNPILVRVVQGTDDLVGLQVPLFDTSVPGSAEKSVSLKGKRLDAIVMRGFKAGRGGDDATFAVGNVEDFNGVIL